MCYTAFLVQHFGSNMKKQSSPGHEQAEQLSARLTMRTEELERWPAAPGTLQRHSGDARPADTHRIGGHMQASI